MNVLRGTEYQGKVIVLPVALAALVSGTIWFHAAHYYLGIQHPTWVVWGVLIAAVLWRLVFIGLERRTTLHALDIVALMFVATIAISLYLKGLGDAQQSAIYLSAFIGLPYLAGRLAGEVGVRLFLNATLAIIASSLPLIFVALILLPEADLLDDRIKGLFGAYYINKYIGLAAGSLVVMLIAGFVAPCEYIWRRYKVVGLSLLAATLWLLVFVTARGDLLAALIVGALILLFGKWVNAQRRGGILLFIIVVIGVSSQTLPERRVEFVKELLAVVPALPGAPSAALLPSAALPSAALPSAALPSVEQCHYVKGVNSPVAHLLYYQDALRLFRKAPFWGVGAGNFGYDAACGQAAAFASPHSTLLHAFAELGIVGGGLLLISAVLIFVGLIRIAISNNKAPLRNVAWLILSLWGFLFLCDQISGNYFTSYHFYAVTGIAGAILAAGSIKHSASTS